MILRSLICLSVFVSLSALAQSTGDYLFQKRAASGPSTAVWVTPSGSDLLKFDGNGGITTLSTGAFAPYSGSTSITQLGTVVTGTWNANTITVAKGGTGNTSLAAGYVLIGAGTTAINALAPGTSGNVLTSNGSAWVSSAPAGGGLTIGTTSITSGTSGRVLYDNGGTLGEMTTSGSGTQLALATSPTFTTGITVTGASANLVVESIAGSGNFASTVPQLTFGTSAALRYTTGYGLAVTNSAGSALGNLQVAALNASTNIQLSTSYYLQDTSGATFQLCGASWNSLPGLRIRSTGMMGFSSSSSSAIAGDATFFTAEGAAIMQLGSDSATPVAQTFKAPDGVGTNIAGANLVLQSGRGTGTGGSGKVVIQTAPAGASGSTANTMRTVLEARNDGHIDMPAATVEAAAAAASTNKITIYINGTRYKILAIQE